MDAGASQAVLYQTLSLHIAPMAIRLILVSFSQPVMVGNWTVSSIMPNVFSIASVIELIGQAYLVGDDKVCIS